MGRALVLTDLPIFCREVRFLAFKITPVGSSSGLIFTTEAMTRLEVRKGDTLYLTEAPGGGYRSTPYDPAFARRMALAEDIMHDDRAVLRAVAK